MESAFNEGNATWEITRYSGVDHGYTLPSSEAFNLEADARSWESMLTTFQELLAQPQTTGMNTPGPNMEDDEETGDPEDNSAAGRWSSAMCALAAGAIVLAL